MVVFIFGFINIGLKNITPHFNSKRNAAISGPALAHSDSLFNIRNIESVWIQKFDLFLYCALYCFLPPGYSVSVKRRTFLHTRIQIGVAFSYWNFKVYTSWLRFKFQWTFCNVMFQFKPTSYIVVREIYYEVLKTLC